MEWDEAMKELYLPVVMHNKDCASLRPYMTGGVSTDVNSRPNAHEVRPKCDCGAEPHNPENEDG